jgi:hypothetical protein
MLTLTLQSIVAAVASGAHNPRHVHVRDGRRRSFSSCFRRRRSRSDVGIRQLDISRRVVRAIHGLTLRPPGRDELIEGEPRLSAEGPVRGRTKHAWTLRKD